MKNIIVERYQSIIDCHNEIDKHLKMVGALTYKVLDKLLELKILVNQYLKYAKIYIEIKDLLPSTIDEELYNGLDKLIILVESVCKFIKAQGQRMLNVKYNTDPILMDRKTTMMDDTVFHIYSTIVKIIDSIDDSFIGFEQYKKKRRFRS